MSAAQEVATEAPALDAVPKKAMTLGYGTSLAILALLIIVPLFVKNFIIFQLTMLLIYGFAAAVLGGLTSPLGAVVGGFLVGVFENLAGTYIPGVGNELKLPIALALIITVLVVKPAGLFGRPIVKRV
jgi:branched-chain amino acid transport system permease protein